MKGNFHVQFLGEGVAATSPPYPTKSIVGPDLAGATRQLISVGRSFFLGRLVRATWRGSRGRVRGAGRLDDLVLLIDCRRS